MLCPVATRRRRYGNGRQWFKSRQGLKLTQTPRSWAFCNHTVLQKEVFAVNDLSRETLFADNPAVAPPLTFASMRARR
ncbi:hypothetical protein [Sodalis praecaptivus]|uniref:hypothetical protein n=1 Tax=Sodalis praecaptivus TaxID=1239307 RepID=UPI0027FCAF68|nr:hypothetical protein [Sodalis praecaptivus]CAJ0999317.1 hypothetical protein NVIRENTERO_03772 [Sodalis praecaptivus]